MRPLLALLVAAPVLAQEEALVRPPLVRATTIDGREWFDVRAQNASALGVLRELARAAGREVDGLDALASPALITVELERRSLDQVLEYVLGSLGLRFELQRSTISILEGTPPTAEDALDEAAAAWMRASRRFPDHPSAAQARLSQGEIAETRGLHAAARSTYLSVVEDYPTSDAVGEATMRAGRISASLGQWGEASRLFRTLANSDVAPEYHAAARLEWARSMIALGDPQAALYMLSALDTSFPTTDATELTARRLVRARALNESGRHLEALEEIDLADHEFDSFGNWEALHVRAVALEGIGLPGEAARAWLLYAREARGHDVALAYQQAARLALAAEDELAVLFVAQQAELAGVADGLEAHVRSARERLGLSVDAEAESVVDRLARAEAWLDEGDHERASVVLQPLFLARGALEPDLGARVCVGWARCLAETAGLRSALDVLVEARPTFASSEARRRIDVGAARLFEDAGRFDDAVEAYQGRYARP